ncbi:MAG: DUF6272 family protein [bacterium]|nr:DUF6272 family protein [bacterium]
MKAPVNTPASDSGNSPEAQGVDLHLGDRIEWEQNTENFFSISLLPIDIFDHWDRCGDIADFIATYFQYNFQQPASQNIISTVVNELVENAVKYSRNKSSPVRIEIRKRQDHLLLRVSNLIPRNQRDHFVAICQALFERDLEELYLEKLTRGQQDHTYSGIGLILLKKDYEALIGVDFFQTQENTLKVEISLEMNVK